MPSRPSIPRKQTLVMRFTTAKRRLARQTDDVAKLANARIGTATGELNQITDDIQRAQGAPKEPPAIPKQPREAIQLAIYTVGKILRRSKIDR